MRGQQRWSIGSWLTPTLVLVEVALVSSGVLGIGTAVLLAVVIEAALAGTVIIRGISAVRRIRSARGSGHTGWAAAEDGLAALLPRPVARALLIEARLWVCSLRWITGRHDGRTSSNAYPYGRTLRILLGVLLGATALEGAIVDMVLMVLLPGTAWPWVALGLHAYALVWIAGLLASLHTRPHLLDSVWLRLRDSVFTEVTVARSAIIGASRIRQPGPPRSGWRIDPAGDTATLTYGEATIALTLDPNESVYIEGRPPVTGLGTLYISANDPQRLLQALQVSGSCASTQGHEQRARC